MTQKIVINVCYGGFGLSDEALGLYERLKGGGTRETCYYDIPRDDLILCQVVEELGEAANDRYAELKIIEIPGGVDWVVEEYDGIEWVAEKHRTWN